MLGRTTTFLTQGGPGGALAFHALRAPTREDVTDVVRRTAARVVRILRAHDRSVEPAGQVGDGHPLPVDEPALAAYYAAAAQGVSVVGERAGKPTLRVVVSESPTGQSAANGDEPVAEVGGVNVHAKPRRRFMQVDPDNRLVAGSLEILWNDALRDARRPTRARRARRRRRRPRRRPPPRAQALGVAARSRLRPPNQLHPVLRK